MKTYEAILRDDRIEWVGEKPESLDTDQATRVSITVDTQQPRLSSDWRERQERALAALDRIASAGGVPSIPDPVEWQREMREDRPLLGRE